MKFSKNAGREPEVAEGWRMPDGRTLVGGPTTPLSTTLLHLHGILGPDGEPLTVQRVYYVLDASGALDRVYDTTTVSVEFELSATTYRVEGTTLYAYRSAVDSHVRESRHERRVEHAGLVPLPPHEVPSPELVGAALADLERREEGRAATDRGSHEALRASFVAALPDRPGREALDLELTLEGDRPVVRLDGRVLWRAPETEFPHRTLMFLLRSALSAAWRDRPADIVPSPDILAHPLWDPWN
ncbi:hypothetical protein FHS43_002333 [Streptosporangium becharense]|uniref:Uncharacterized protein n=1 Tax=Streptosporangium becharense TaxID=1816182 RepID=A0A7W9IKR8_9ACTN|nr:hypothetical protein [Streptosporangium becharense]MBB2911068.1 hypothetical protein [Streptosporangium becharense]MBB5821874.1 hypothetical protein [Streptosporangium becharense]